MSTFNQGDKMKEKTEIWKDKILSLSEKYLSGDMEENISADCSRNCFKWAEQIAEQNTSEFFTPKIGSLCGDVVAYLYHNGSEKQILRAEKILFKELTGYVAIQFKIPPEKKLTFKQSVKNIRSLFERHTQTEMFVAGMILKKRKIKKANKQSKNFFP